MSLYFTQFPIINYNMTGKNSDFKEVVDLWRRVKVRSKIVNEISVLDKYDVQEGDSPEIVAYKVYGSTDLFWIVCLMNNIVNRYYDWPLDEFTFQQFVADKYDNPEGIHHYEITQTSGDTTEIIDVGLNTTDYPSATAISNYQYEDALQNERRQIRLIQPRFMDDFVEEFETKIKEGA